MYKTLNNGEKFLGIPEVLNRELFKRSRRYSVRNGSFDGVVNHIFSLIWGHAKQTLDKQISHNY